MLDVSEPGLVVVKHTRSDGFGKFANIAVLTGDEIRIVDEQNLILPQKTSLANFADHHSWKNSVNLLLQLAVSMHAHRRGGTLLVVPSGSNSWQSSIRHPLHYAITPNFSGLSTLMKEEVHEQNTATWQRTMSREVGIVAGLTALDGAVIINDRYELLAFGEKIKRSDESRPIEQIMITEPVIGGEAVIVNPALTGGTRHLSAAQFVQDQKDAIALVASQDGHFTVFSWSENENIVHAHRIDSLLL